MSSKKMILKLKDKIKKRKHVEGVFFPFCDTFIRQRKTKWSMPLADENLVF